MNSHLIIHNLTSEGESEVSKQANEWAVQANERKDEQLAQYSNLYSWLFWTTVHRENEFVRVRGDKVTEILKIADQFAARESSLFVK